MDIVVGHAKFGEHVIAEYAGYNQITDEAIQKAGPDVILMMNNGGDHSAGDELLKNPLIAATPAGQSKNLVRMDGLYLLGFGPRTGAAVRELAAKFYGTETKQ